MAAFCVSMVKEMWAPLAGNAATSCSGSWYVRAGCFCKCSLVLPSHRSMVLECRLIQKIHSRGAEMMYTPPCLLCTQMLYWGPTLLYRHCGAANQFAFPLGLSMGPP